jgi:hypothetical protein
MHNLRLCLNINIIIGRRSLLLGIPMLSIGTRGTRGIGRRSLVLGIPMLSIGTRGIGRRSLVLGIPMLSIGTREFEERENLSQKKEERALSTHEF